MGPDSSDGRSMTDTILVTGGAGYIGAHTCVELLAAGYRVMVLDNLGNGSARALERVRTITGKAVELVEGDVRDRALLDQLFTAHAFSAVVHFAGLKAVGESCAMPLTYYENNVGGTITLCQAMAHHQVRRLVFSSSATVYGEPARLPATEDMPLSATNPYGRSKLFIEEILRDLYRADGSWRIALLRYFNPTGAHPSGLLGEDPHGIPSNLMPYIAQVASGRRKQLQVFGGDYDTPDGTGVRDYIHVVDLALGHVRAIRKLSAEPGRCDAWNLGVGKGYSVLEVVAAFARISGQNIPYVVGERRPGDIAACYANPGKAELELNWRATQTLDDMVRDVWRWQTANPSGYDQ